MRLSRVTSGEEIVLAMDAQIGAGGEAVVLPVLSEPGLAAKIYHNPEPTQWRKLQAMLQNPPVDPMAAEHAISIAWPLDRLVTADARRAFAGYLMPRVTGVHPLFEYCNPSSRRRTAPLFSYKYLLRTARNLCAAVNALHERGYVIGDLNESNILVAPSALVTLVDTDSFQVPTAGSDVTGVYRCTVGKPEFTAPELSGISFGEIDRNQTHDNFALAVLIYQILMEGAHPFAGEYTGPGDAPPYADRIAAGHFPHGAKRTPYRPLKISPPLGIMHPGVGALMLRCFEDGHARPALRPSATMWMEALKAAEEALVECEKNDQHVYSGHLEACPWCERRGMLGGRDPFPAKDVVARGEHNPPPRRRKTPLPSVSSSSGIYYGRSSVSLPPPVPPPPVNPVSWAAAGLALAACWSLVVTSPPIPLGAAIAAAAVSLLAYFVAPRWKGSGKIVASCALILALWAGIDGAIDFRDVVSPLPVKTVPLVSPPRAIAFAAGRFVTATERAEDQRLLGGRVQTWNPDTGKYIGMLAEYPGSVYSLQSAADDETLAAAVSSPMEECRMELLKARYTGSHFPQIVTGTGQVCGAISPDARYTAMGMLNGTVLVISTANQHVVNKLRLKGEVLALAFAPNSKQLAIGTGSPPGGIRSGAITMVDATTGNKLWEKEGHGNALTALAFAPNGSEVVTGGANRAVQFRNALTGEPGLCIEADASRVTAICFSRDGKLLAVGYDPMGDQAEFAHIGMYTVGSTLPYTTLPGHSQRITGLVFSADSKLLGSVGLDMNLKIWRLNRFKGPVPEAH